jgi:NAD(P)H-dependent FMN reductase
MEKLKILALSGSLRKHSYNTAAIKALEILSPNNIEVVIGDIGGLPLFNPDLEEQHIPSLQYIKASLKESSGLILATPEYAHGISGPLKNALDWLVNGIEFPLKPVMLVNTSPRASHAQTHLREVLTTMSANIIENAYVSIPLLSSGLDYTGITEDKKLANLLQTGLAEFCDAIEALKHNKVVY